MTAALTLVPMVPAAAKAWHTLQTLMLNGAHGLDVTPHGAIVLLPLPGAELPVLTDSWDGRVQFSSWETNAILSIGQDHHNSNRYTKRYSKPDGWKDGWWRPEYWSLTMNRVDSDGRRWSHTGGDYVMDDFGDLVEVKS